MDEGKQLTFRRRNFIIDVIRELILSLAPVKGRKRPANREALAHSNQTAFPRRIGIRDPITRRKNIPLLLLVPHGFEQCDAARFDVTRHAHSAALPDELWTGRRAL